VDGNFDTPSATLENFYAGPISRINIASTLYHTITIPAESRNNPEPRLNHDESIEKILPLDPIVEAHGVCPPHHG